MFKRIAQVLAAFALLAGAGAGASAVQAQDKYPTKVTRWNQEVARIMKTDAMQKWFLNEGMDPAGGPPEQFFNRIKSDAKKWKRVVREAKIPLAG